jgi:uncharacterized protein (TIGR04141 family)
MGETEPAYLERYVCDGRAVVLHPNTVRPFRSTSQVEICDILSRENQLIHIKRHLGARDLSHLFSQGLVSAELLQDDPEFRIQAAELAEDVSEGTGTVFLVDELRPSEFSVIFGIIADWRGRTLEEALPLFSKVSLRSCSKVLRGRYFRVGCCRIGVDDGGTG